MIRESPSNDFFDLKHVLERLAFMFFGVHALLAVAQVRADDSRLVAFTVFFLTATFAAVTAPEVPFFVILDRKNSEAFRFC